MRNLKRLKKYTDTRILNLREEYIWSHLNEVVPSKYGSQDQEEDRLVQNVMYVDFSRINAVIIQDAYPLSHIKVFVISQIF